MNEFFTKFDENYKTLNPQNQEAQQVQECEENHIKVPRNHKLKARHKEKIGEVARERRGVMYNETKTKITVHFLS